MTIPPIWAQTEVGLSEIRPETAIHQGMMFVFFWRGARILGPEASFGGRGMFPVGWSRDRLFYIYFLAVRGGDRLVVGLLRYRRWALELWDLPKIDTKILPRAVVISKITDGGRADLSESRRIFCEVICCS